MAVLYSKGFGPLSGPHSTQIKDLTVGLPRVTSDNFRVTQWEEEEVELLQRHSRKTWSFNKEANSRALT